MAELEIADEFAIRTVLARYCHRCDDGDIPGLLELFTADAVYTYGQAVAEGTAGLTEFFAPMRDAPHRRGKHLTVNIVAEPAGPDAATALSDFVVLRIVDGQLMPVMAGRYADTLVRSGGAWRISRRDTLLMRAPA
ncbi:nuclear transport factor 2 family protein [Pseudofrankia asymbiotica]|uniref:nuclear transport factor 2 family protein n=1 Tax=Pseudofrankia asymbiotica TaxID=1834516 RepID=UPI0009762509|nr:nuclear transport factor 2 family protein [Pseudofrankia asymbiotica]